VLRSDVWTGTAAPNEGAALNTLNGGTAPSPCNVWAIGFYQDAVDSMSLSLAGGEASPGILAKLLS